MEESQQIAKFVEKHPKLYHMAEAGSWCSIRKHGLLSVAALLDLFKVKGKQRDALYSNWRCKSVPIQNSVSGKAVIRDQHPIPPERLKNVLCEGLCPREWYEILNSKCFFWVTEERLIRMLKAYGNRTHDVITLDTRKLLDKHSERIAISHINTGSVRGQAMRGKDTFHKIQECCLVGRKNGIAELTVEWEVPNVEEIAVLVEVRKGNKTIETIWQS